VRIPSWLGAVGPLHSEAVYIGADRFRYQTVSLAIRRRTIHIPQKHIINRSIAGSGAANSILDRTLIDDLLSNGIKATISSSTPRRSQRSSSVLPNSLELF